MPVLLLLRHAKAAGGPVDVERPLTAPGKEQARRVADHLAREGLFPTVVLCSSALRTRQTWEQVEAGLTDYGAPAAVVHWEDALYGARPTTVLELVADRGAGEVTLVVGHEPVMSMTAGQLAGPGSDRTAEFSVRNGIPTATLAVVDLAEWGATTGTLRALLRTPL